MRKPEKTKSGFDIAREKYQRYAARVARRPAKWRPASHNDPYVKCEAPAEHEALAATGEAQATHLESDQHKPARRRRQAKRALSHEGV